METKDTTIKWRTQSGKDVIVKVHRQYGSYIEHHHDSENGIDYTTNEFANNSTIDVEVVGVCKFRTKYLPSTKHPKINMYYLAGEYSGKNHVVAVPDDVAEQIRTAESELLTDELSPSVRADINAAKKAIIDNKVLPAAELNRKRRDYNNLYNEGGDGFNPYDYYLTAEHVSNLKQQYPDQF